MSCGRCGSEFGIFKKENYCRNCGFSFCSSCLTKKIIVPKTKSNSKHLVCNNCYSILTEGNANKPQTQPSPPAALLKRMEALNSNQYSNGQSNLISNHNGVDADKIISQRLQNLRTHEPAPTLTQLEERLAKLRGGFAESSSTGNKDIGLKVDKRSEFEKAQDLLNQVSEEAKIDSKILKPEEEIRLRLARLKSDDTTLNDLNKPPTPINTTIGGGILPQDTFLESISQSDSNPDVLEVWKYMMEKEREACRAAEEALYLQEHDLEFKKKFAEIKANRDTSIRKSGISVTSGDVSDDDNEDKLANKVVQQFLAEAKLDLQTYENETKLINSAKEMNDELEELPWCTICNEDATHRCYGCDGELYCRRCFKESHDAELRDHPSVPYLTKRKIETAI